MRARNMALQLREVTFNGWEMLAMFWSEAADSGINCYLRASLPQSPRRVLIEN